MANPKFQFNLLEKTVKEIQVVREDRDNTLLFSVILVFSFVLFYFLLSLLNLFIIEPEKAKSSRDITTSQRRISGFQSFINIKEELYLKSNAILPIIELDIRLNDLLLVAQNISTSYGNVVVTSYQREVDGRLGMTLRFSELNIGKLVSVLRNIEIIDSFFVRSIRLDSMTGEYILSFNFNTK